MGKAVDRILEDELVRSLSRDDGIGSAERRSVVRSMLTALDHLEALCRSSRANHRLLLELLDNDGEPDDNTIDDAPDSVTVTTLYEILNAGNPSGIWRSRLEFIVISSIEKAWEQAKNDEVRDATQATD